MYTTHIQKDGDLHYIPIPKKFLDKSGLDIGSVVDLHCQDGHLVITKETSQDSEIRSVVLKENDQTLHCLRKIHFVKGIPVSYSRIDLEGLNIDDLHNLVAKFKQALALPEINTAGLEDADN